MTEPQRTPRVGERPAQSGRRRGAMRYLHVPASLWLTVLFLAPVGVLLGSSFFAYDGPQVTGDISLNTYSSLLSDSYFWSVLWLTCWISVAVALLCIAMAFPLARFMVTARGRTRGMLLLLVTSPLVASVVIRTYGWLVLFERDGLISKLFSVLGLTPGPVNLIGNPWAIVIGLTHVLLPFCVFTILSSLGSINPQLEQAAHDLGAGTARTFWKVVFPLSLPGVVAGGILVFAISMGAFATPFILGGGRTRTLAVLVRSNMVTLLDWGSAAALAMVIFAVGLVVILIVLRFGPLSRLPRMR